MPSVYFKDPNARPDQIDSQTVQPNLTLDDALLYLRKHTSREWQDMVTQNFSLGIERDEKQLIKNNQDHTKWSNPLEVQLPHAPSMQIYCLYGWGKTTERGYFYSRSEEDVTRANATEDPAESGHEPLRMSWIDSNVHLDQTWPKVVSGVVNGEGDGTVSILSSGAMCVEGWQRKRYNPAGIKVVTHELLHEPLAFDPRGGPTTADHIDALGTTVVNEAVLQIASGHGCAIAQLRFDNIG